MQSSVILNAALCLIVMSSLDLPAAVPLASSSKPFKNYDTSTSYHLEKRATKDYDFSWAPKRDKIPPGNLQLTALFLGGNPDPNILHPELSMSTPFDPLPSQVINDVTVGLGYTDWKYCNDTLPNQIWGISYDDGPNQPNTNKVLDYLASPASLATFSTFFVVGSRVIEEPELLLRAHTEGHQIGIHTWSHPYLTNLTNDEIVAEIVYTAMAIYEVIGVVPKYFRPPYGNVDNRVRAIIKAMGLRNVMWALDSTDSLPGQSAAGVEAVANDWMSNGIFHAISLEHDLLDIGSTTIPSVLSILINSGLAAKPIYECLGQDRGDMYAESPLSAFIERGSNQLLFPSSNIASPTETTSVPIIFQPAGGSNASIVPLTSTERNSERKRGR